MFRLPARISAGCKSTVLSRSRDSPPVMFDLDATTSPTRQREGAIAFGLLIRFGVVGAATTLLDLVLFNMLSGPWGRLPIVPAHLLASVVTLTISFFGQRNLVFRRQEERAGNQAMRFILVTLIGVCLVQSLVLTGTAWMLVVARDPSGLLAWVPADRWPWVQRNLAKAAAMTTGIAWNFLWFRCWVFRKESRERFNAR